MNFRTLQALLTNNVIKLYQTPQVFLGNEDKNTPVTNLLPEPVNARFVRIVPRATAQDGGAMRVELKGCDMPPDIIGEPDTFISFNG